MKLGVSSEDTDGVVDIEFNAATTGQFGVKAVGAAYNSAAIYGSSQDSPSYPTGGTIWAGWFDGNIYSKGYFVNTAQGNMKGGLNGAVRIDDSDTWFVFAGGICIGYRNPRDYDPDADE